MPLDRERLAKVLSLTQSSSDGEALAAIRKANEIIKGENLTWDEVLIQIADAVGAISITINRGFSAEGYADFQDAVRNSLRRNQR